MTSDEPGARRGRESALFTRFSYDVPESDIDYNGHMTDAAYAKVISDANECFLEDLGLSAAYRNTGKSVYTVELTIRFLREVKVHDVLSSKTRLVMHDQKRLRFVTTLLGSDGRSVATGEALYLHVDAERGRVVEFQPEQVQQFDRVQAEHDAVPLSP